MSARSPERAISRVGAGGLRRDTPILLPASLLLFATLASVTLLSYRAAVASFAAEREQATLRLAVALADAARLLKGEDVGPLVRGLPSGAALAIYDARGAVRSSYGFTGPDAVALPLPRASEVAAPLVVGLGATGRAESAEFGTIGTSGTLRALAPFDRSGQRYLLRLDIREPTLYAQQRSLRILTPVVFGLSFAVALLAIFFLRALVRPYEALIARAKTVASASTLDFAGHPLRGTRDDVEFLLATFDRALAALRTASAPATDPVHSTAALDDLSAVERTLGPQLESGLLLFDRDGGLLAANPAAADLLGAASDAVGTPPRESARETARAALLAHPALAALIAEAIAQGRSIQRASVAIERAGRTVELGMTLQALRPSGFLVLFADITDLSRRETEERFAAGLAQLGELSAGVAHELRNSLATVQGYLTLAARRELPEAAREEIAEARRETEELARIVDDFLTFARPGSGVLEPVDLATLLRRAIGDPALAGVSFELTLPDPRLPTVAGDPHLLQRALRNLLLNAAQATLAARAPAGAGSGENAPAPVVVDLCSAPGAPGQARITIDDAGAGLAPEIADRLFEPFASGRPGGAGLGLALARRIVVMHGGTLSLAPRVPLGVRVEIRLPLGRFDTEGISSI